MKPAKKPAAKVVKKATSSKTMPWTKEELALLKTFKHPMDIQLFLNSIPYNHECTCRSPRLVMKYKRAHCFEGALFAAAALRFLGYDPIILDMGAWNDDDHVVALFKENGRWGSIAKSNFTTIRYREPVYKSTRELVLSYFDFYFNSLGQKTLRSYSRPVRLAPFDVRDWMTTDHDLEFLGDHLTKIHHYPLMNAKMVKSLREVDPDLVKAGLLGSDPKGLFKPKA